MMKRKLFTWLLLLALTAALLAGCGAAAETPPLAVETLPAETPHIAETPPAVETPPAEEALPDGESIHDSETPPAGEAPAPTPSPAPEEEEPAVPAEDGTYTDPETVAAYIHQYGHLPDNYLTKNEARDLGWDNRQGNLWDVAPGMSIGGDRFGNYEGLLPEGKYRECDVNYAGGYRGGERLIYDEKGGVWYTGDHYASFTQLYAGE